MQSKVPIISKDLAEYLEKMFPQFLPQPCDNIQEIFFKSGQASVSLHIKRLYEKQQRQTSAFGR